MIRRVSAGQRMQRRSRCVILTRNTLGHFKSINGRHVTINYLILLASARPCRSGRHRKTPNVFFCSQIAKNEMRVRRENRGANKRTKNGFARISIKWKKWKKNEKKIEIKLQTIMNVISRIKFSHAVVVCKRNCNSIKPHEVYTITERGPKVRRIG